MKTKIKKSTLIPLLLLLYLAYMAYLGLPYLQTGRYLYYFGIIAATLIIIVLLHYTLKYREKQKVKEREDDTYSTYAEKDKSNNDTDGTESK